MQFEDEPDVGDDGFVHVLPTFGREHVLDGLECWCHPTQNTEVPFVIIHNVEN